MSLAPAAAVVIANSLVTTPAVVIRPILLAVFSVNHRAPSGPAVMAEAPLEAVGIANSVMQIVGVVAQPASLVGSSRPIWLAFGSANQRFPSGPAAMLLSVLKKPAFEGVGYSVTVPSVVTRQICELFPALVNQSAPSEPAVML